MSRKLASIQKIWKIEPIEGADKIELAHVLGWQCVVQKGQFKEGNYCVYFEIDSFLPVKPEFEFLRKSSYRFNPILGEGFRIKTMKMKGQISQGLVMPCETFPILWYDQIEQMYCVVPSLGQDVTELLGVRKWEIEERATTGGTTIGNLPYGVPHTDEERIQTIPELLELFRDKKYYITTKCDGFSHSVFIDEDEKFHVTGHNFEYKDDGHCAFYEFVKKNDIESKIRVWKKNQSFKIDTICIQGEWCGAGLQGNRLRLQQPDWFIFTLIINGKRACLDEMNRFALETGIHMVPLEETGINLPEKYPDIDALLKRAEIKYPCGNTGEGIVIRTVVPEQCRLTESGYLSFKVINNKYLLKNED